VYKSSSGAAKVRTAITIGAGARLCWLPQETILFNQAQLNRNLEIDMQQSAECLLCEPIIFGRQHMGERFLKGEMTDRWHIRQQGKLIHLEAMRISPLSLPQKSGFDNAGAAATLLFISPKAEALFSKMNSQKTPEMACGYWQNKLMVRLIARDGYQLRKTLFPILKELMQGVPLPKVWSL
jgi:urease accessory protein